MVSMRIYVCSIHEFAGLGFALLIAPSVGRSYDLRYRRCDAFILNQILCYKMGSVMDPLGSQTFVYREHIE